ncbi:MAG: hypothetical protein K6C94_06640 [Candidatus Gastranaerophilales bacterium]|nr:hypothetical protein [Candidatus Gastranaerophilales bacterium]
MNRFDEKMIKLLRELKENYHAIGLKAEFETEGTTTKEALRLTNIASMAGVDFSLKIGGCGAIKDLYDARKAGANIIVAPMIESAYAVRKFIEAVKIVFPTETPKILINIETKTGLDNFDKIISSEDFHKIDGVVFGRTDMVNSLNLPIDEVNSSQIFDMAKDLSIKIQKSGKIFIVGGQINTEAVSFCKNLPYLSGYETRKIIFDIPNILLYEKAYEGILKAIEFEMLWLKNKQERLLPRDEDTERIKILEQRCLKA